MRLRYSSLLLGIGLALCACGEDSAGDPVGSGGQGLSSTTGGAGGAGASGGGTGGSAGPCPEGAGPAMKKLPEGYCIDTTEVTRAHYEAWLATTPEPASQLEPCSWNDDFTPTSGWPPGSDGELPVVGVDWCDAQAFCVDAGKRLCGQIGGGANGYDDYADATKSQWFSACSSGGSYDYTYGDTHDPTACRGGDDDQWAWVEVGSLSGCQSPDAPYAGVFDLSGNAMEWEDSCDAAAGESDNCRIRGGSFNHSGPGLRCDMGEILEFARSNRYVGVGFRCCAY